MPSSISLIRRRLASRPRRQRVDLRVARDTVEVRERLRRRAEAGVEVDPVIAARRLSSRPSRNAPASAGGSPRRVDRCRRSCASPAPTWNRVVAGAGPAVGRATASPFAQRTWSARSQASRACLSDSDEQAFGRERRARSALRSEPPRTTSSRPDEQRKHDADPDDRGSLRAPAMPIVSPTYRPLERR